MTRAWLVALLAAALVALWLWAEVRFFDEHDKEPGATWGRER